MDGRCERHLFDQAVDRCIRCGGEFCNTCVVYSFGPRKPPFCLPCAVEAAGVRSGAGSAPALSRREQRRLVKERKRERRAAAEAAPPRPDSADWSSPADPGTSGYEPSSFDAPAFDASLEPTGY